MPKFYCDYCDTFLTHDSRSVRKTHCSGRQHRDAVRMYYQKWLEEQVQKLVDNTTAAFKSGRAMHLHPPPRQPPMGAGGRMPTPGGYMPPPGYHAPPPPHSGAMIPPPVGIGAAGHQHHPPSPFGGGGGPPHGYRGLGPPMPPPGVPPQLGIGGPPRMPMGHPPRGLPPRPLGLPPGMR